MTSNPDPRIPDHAWNAVHFDSSWHLLDLTWAAAHSQFGRRKIRIDDKYFLSDPTSFVEDHLPAMPMWQLLPCPVPMASWINDLPSTDSTLCLNYRDSIRMWQSLSHSGKILKEYEMTYEFHPTRENRNQLGHGLFDYGGLLIDSIEMDSDGPAIPKAGSYYRQAFGLFRRAQAMVNLYDWQKELFSGTLINYGTMLFNRLLSRDSLHSEKGFDRIIRLLDEAEGLLREVNSYYAGTAKTRIGELKRTIRKITKEN